MTWASYQLEIICRVDPANTAPAAPDLTPSTGWTTFLAPREKGTDLEAMAAGFAPPGKLGWAMLPMCCMAKARGWKQWFLR